MGSMPSKWVGTSGASRPGGWAGQQWTLLLEDGDVLQVGAAEVRVTMPDHPELGAKLIELAGLADLRVFLLESKPTGHTIGRAGGGADIQLRGSPASRLHARLTLVDRGWWLADAGSAGGTFVNELRITDRRLAHGDEVQIGAERLLFIHHERSAVAFGETDEQPKDPMAAGDDTRRST
jgi:hypothetical protein